MILKPASFICLEFCFYFWNYDFRDVNNSNKANEIVFFSFRLNYDTISAWIICLRNRNFIYCLLFIVYYLLRVCEDRNWFFFSFAIWIIKAIWIQKEEIETARRFWRKTKQLLYPERTFWWRLSAFDFVFFFPA